MANRNANASGDKPLPSAPTTGSERISSFPTFLNFDPFPSSTSGRPLSATSDTPSEFFDANSRPISTLSTPSGPVGEPGLPPSRPSSVSTVHAGESKRASGVRASLPPPPSRRGFAALGAKRDSRDDMSRPSSSMSKTHVPSLVAQGFSRPMSPLTLQAQRGSRLGPVSPAPLELQMEEESPRRSRSHRHSNASVYTMRDGPPKFSMEEAPAMPESRGSMFATSSPRDTLPDGTTAGSVTSNSPLTSRPTRRHAPDALRLSPNAKRLSATASSQKSPRSLRDMLSRRSTAEHKPLTHGHEKLSSTPTSPVLTPHKPNALDPTGTQPSRSKGPHLGRNYEYFAGNLIFCLSGRFLNTRARPLNVATFILTTLPAVLFFAFSAPFLWHHVSPALPIIFAYVFLLAESAFFHAAFSDPGILPRNLHPHPPNPEEDRDPLTPGPPTTEWVMVKTFPGRRRQVPDPEASQGGVTAMEVPTKYCKSCSIWRPPRTHHCRVCDACMETQDHHCVWLNNCVGRRNYRYFFAYVGFVSLLALLLLVFSIVHVTAYAMHHKTSFRHALSAHAPERVAFAMFLYGALALPYPGSLFCYHLFLTARGETTREYLNSHKFNLKDRHRPFSMADWSRNWAAVFSRPRPPTYMGFKRRYEPGDVRFGHTHPEKERAEQAKREATESQSRVAGLKNRFSVVGNGASRPENNGAGRGGLMGRLSGFRPVQATKGTIDVPGKESISADGSPTTAVEMKSLPALAPKGAGGGPGIPVNNTPR